jgi:hypothetical protein
MRIIKRWDVHLGPYYQSLQFRHGIGGKRQRPVDMELLRLQWRLNDQLFCKYSEVDGNGDGGSKWCCQPCITDDKQQYKGNCYGNADKRIYCIGRRHLWRDFKRHYLHNKPGNRQLLGNGYILG